MGKIIILNKEILINLERKYLEKYKGILNKRIHDFTRERRWSLVEALCTIALFWQKVVKTLRKDFIMIMDGSVQWIILKILTV